MEIEKGSRRIARPLLSLRVKWYAASIWQNARNIAPLNPKLKTVSMKFFLVLVLVSVAAGFFLFNVSAGVFYDLLSWTKQAPRLSAPRVFGPGPGELPLGGLAREVSTPSPLRIFQPSSIPAASLSAEGILQWTNVHRQQAGLQILSPNALLDEIAQAKVEDMFVRQYFEHVSPSGESISHLAEEFGYEFLAIGENLALGNYESDQALVQAWMDRPGERANNLKTSYF